jgi:hypothetical protein
MATREFEFYLKTDLSKYEGKYIAIVGEEVAAVGDNAKDVWWSAKKKFPKKIPFLVKVPKAETLILSWKLNLDSRESRANS